LNQGNQIWPKNKYGLRQNSGIKRNSAPTHPEKTLNDLWTNVDTTKEKLNKAEYATREREE
jgi:hypothetical protein